MMAMMRMPDLPWLWRAVRRALPASADRTDVPHARSFGHAFWTCTTSLIDAVALETLALWDMRPFVTPDSPRFRRRAAAPAEERDDVGELVGPQAVLRLPRDLQPPAAGGDRCE